MKRKWGKGVVLPALALAIAPERARAARVLQWDASASPGIQGGTGIWNSSNSRWDLDGLPAQWFNNGQDTAIFSGTPGGIIAIDTAISAAVVRFDAPGYTLNSAASALTLTSGSMIVNADVVVNAPLTATSGFVKSGAGVLTLGGANTFGGGTIRVTAGTLAFGNDTNLGVTQNDIWLSGATLRYSALASLSLPSGRTVRVDAAGGTIDLPGAMMTLATNGQLAGTGTLTKRGVHVLRVTGTNAAFNGAVDVAAGTLLLTNPSAVNGRPITLSGGTLQVNADASTHYGSSLAVTADSVLRLSPVGSGGPLGVEVGLGAASVAAGATLDVASTLAHELRVASLDLAGRVRLNLEATLVTGSLAIGAGGKLELGANPLVVDYEPGGSAVAEVAANLALGRITGTAGAGLALGFGEAADLLGLSGEQTGEFEGVTVDASAVLVRTTQHGDANLDGRVTFADFQRLERGFGRAGYWGAGDFDHSGFVDHDDFMILYQNFGQALGGAAAAVNEADWAVLEAYAGRHDVPEPGAVFWIGMFSSLSFGRCRKRRASAMTGQCWS